MPGAQVTGYKYDHVQLAENADIWLTTYLNVCFSFWMVPFRIRYDETKNIYKIQVSTFRQVTLGVVLFCTLFLFYIDVLQGPKLRNLFNSKGPLKVFLFSFDFGNYAVSLVQIIFVLAPSTRQLFLRIITDLRHNKPVKSSRHRSRLGQLILLQIAIPAFTLLYFETASFLSKGYQNSLLSRWISIAAPFHYPRMITSYSELSLWMILFTGILEIVTFIRNLFFSSAMSLLLMASLTLQHISKSLLQTIQSEIWFTSRVKILGGLVHVENIISLLSSLLSTSLFTVFLYFTVSTCVILVKLFSDDLEGNPMAAVILLSYLCWTMIASADAIITSRKIVNTILRKSDDGRTLINIVTYTATNTGLSCSQFFTVNYAFIAAMILAVVSNTTIVLQSLGTYSQLQAATPPPPPPGRG